MTWNEEEQQRGGRSQAWGLLEGRPEKLAESSGKGQMRRAGWAREESGLKSEMNISPAAISLGSGHCVQRSWNRTSTDLCISWGHNLKLREVKELAQIHTSAPWPSRASNPASRKFLLQPKLVLLRKWPPGHGQATMKGAQC